MATELATKLKELNSAFDENIDRINKLIEAGFLNESVILLVTIFEVYFRDLAKISRCLWFGKPPKSLILALGNKETLEKRNKIKNFLQSIQSYEDFIQNYYVYQTSTNKSTDRHLIGDPDIDTLYITLFGDSKRRLNFQNLKNKNGARNVYLEFYSFDFKKNLNQNSSISTDIWQNLIDFFEIRHNIIHRGGSSEYSKEEIKNILDSVLYLREAAYDMIKEKLSQ